MFQTGDTVWRVHLDIMGRLVAERYFILEVNHRGWYIIGNSRKRASSVTHTNDVSNYYRNKEEAFEAYKRRELTRLKYARLECKKLLQKNAEEYKELLNKTIKGVRVKTYPEDYEPCDF